MNDKNSFFCISTANIHLRVDANGGLNDNGRTVRALVRERILDLKHKGLGQCMLLQGRLILAIHL